MTVGDTPIPLGQLGGMIVNTDYLPLLAATGLDAVERVCRFTGGAVVKRIPDREVIRLELRWEAGPCNLYLKRHGAAPPSLRQFVSGMTGGRPTTPGIAEFQTICDCRAHGIPTATPVAAGQRQVNRFRYESFLITADIAPYVSLETLIRHQPAWFAGADGRRRKAGILEAIAQLARKVHEAGFNHLDFNADHVMVGPWQADGKIPLALLDFQRVDRRTWLRWRWMIKTMAELVYSMPDPAFDDDDRRRLLRHYLGRPEAPWWEALAWRWIVAKARRIGRHTEKIIARQGEDPTAGQRGHTG